MTTTKVLAAYQNGNCRVTIHEDGTKVREWEEGDPNPEFPESIDLKITDYCDAGCPFCHERSTRKGVHAKTEDVLRIVESLPPGVEIAIGGGNPMAHPDLPVVLRSLKERGLVANITVHESHAMEYDHEILRHQRLDSIHGLGISLTDCADAEIILQLGFRENIVWHVIAGISGPQGVIRYASVMDKILVLGYKKFGFGEKFFSPKIKNNMDEWKYWIGTIMRKVPHVSFDNLAIEQLGIRDKITKDRWAESYMGDDGHFTMYADAVKMEFAVSSVSKRHQIGDMDIRSCFGSLRASP